MAKGKRSSKMSGPVGFFYSHGSYSYKEGSSPSEIRAARRECAEDLAHAERVAAAEGWETRWEHDDLPYNLGDGEDMPSEVLSACLRDAAGNILASLSGIGDPDAHYRRVVEAELASEALAHAAELTKRARRK